MFLFNPDNDLALANFSYNYTPPASILKLGGDLSILPLWYSPDFSMIAVQSDTDIEYVEYLKDIFEIGSVVVDIAEINKYELKNIFPWGWNPMLCKKLEELGVDKLLLPSLSELEKLRDYSNRKHSVSLLCDLKSEISASYGQSFYFTDIEKLLHYLSSTEGDKALKMPLSGSGRGLIWILDGITDKQTDWAKRVIRNQGGIVAEPKLKRVQDFAMEFSLSGGKISFEGYSLFNTADSGAYVGNVLMSDRDIEAFLSEYISVDILWGLRDLLTEKLVDYFPLYNGILGVDMMVYDTDDGYKLQPCVEVNMRMNMGMLSHIFYNRFVKSGVKGSYTVEYFKKAGDALAFHQENLKRYPLVVEKNKIVSGYLSLSSVVEDTHYIAYANIDK